MHRPRYISLVVPVLAALMAYALLPGVPSVMAAASITVSPAQVTPGGTLTVSGYGYQPGGTVVVGTTVTVNGGQAPVQTATTAATTGTFSASITIPGGTTAGTYDVTARDFNGNTATEQFQVVPVAVIVAGQTGAQATASPGQVITVAGTGFRASEAVAINIPLRLTNGAAVDVTQTVQANTQGAFGPISLAIPSNASPGGTTITARGSQSGVVGAVPLQIVQTNAHLTLTPTQAAAGSTLTVAGTGFVPNTAVTIVSTVPGSSPGSTLGTTVTADGSGNFTTSLALPTTVPAGAYTVTALSAGGNVRASAGLTVTAPTNLTIQPTSTNPGGTVTVSGSGFGVGVPITVTAQVPLAAGGTQTITLQALATPSGTFSVSLTIPTSAAPGSVTITAANQQNTVRQTGTLTVATPATLTIAPTSVVPGGTTTVTGAGFQPDVPVAVSAVVPLTTGGTLTVTSQSLTTASGTFSTNLTIPATAQQGSVTVTAANLQNTVRATATLTVSGQPTITIQPTPVAPGSTATITATGFVPNEAVTVTATVLTSNGEQAVTVSALPSANGTFTAGLTIPATALPGTVSVAAVQGTTRLTGTLTVGGNPRITLQPTTVLPGGSTTVSGSGFGISVPVMVTASVPVRTGGSQTVSVSAYTGGTGSFSARLTVPNDAAPGPVSVTAVAGSERVANTLTIGALTGQVTISPVQAPPGGTVTVSGSGFAPGDRITVSVPVRTRGGASSTLTVAATANGTGGFSVPLPIPLTVLGGTYTATARSATTGQAVSAQVVVQHLTPSVRLGPTTALPGTRVTVDGSGFAPDSRLTISLNGVTVGTVTANGAGAFSTAVTVPSAATGGTNTVTVTDSAGRSARAALSVRRPISTHFYFASIYTGTRYHEALALLNATKTPAAVTITYERTAGTTLTKSLTIRPQSRYTENVSVDLGTNVSASAVVSADVPISAARMVTFGTDGALDPGTVSPATQWYFANGNTSHGYREYIAIENPNTQPVQVSVRFLPTHHSPVTITRRMPPTSRTTFQVSTYVPRDAVGVLVSAPLPVVANRTIYQATGMTSQTGVSAMHTTWYFGSGPSESLAHNWLAVINPANQSAALTVHIYSQYGAPLMTLTRTLQPYARVGYLMNRLVHRSDVSAVVTAALPVVAEQQTYVQSAKRALTDLFGVTSPATSWQYPGAATGPGQSDTLTLFNPSTAPITVQVQFFTTTGLVATHSYGVPGMSQVHVSVGSVVPNGDVGLKATSTAPFLGVNRHWFSNGYGATTTTGSSQ